MTIVRIFAEKLFAFHYDGEVDNEYDRLMALWTNINYLHKYAKDNKVENIKEFTNRILRNAEEIDDLLNNLDINEETLGFYFEPLQGSERKKILSLQKGKIKKNQLRYYALKIDDDCFVIVGGAIKMSQKMQEHPDKEEELKKLRDARSFLKKQKVFDEDSFYELLIELS